MVAGKVLTLKIPPYGFSTLSYSTDEPMSVRNALVLTEIKEAEARDEKREDNNTTLAKA